MVISCFSFLNYSCEKSWCFEFASMLFDSFSVASDKVLYLFGNQVGEGQRKLLGVNCFKHFNCYNFFSCDEAGVLDLHVMLFEFLFCK